MYQRLRIALVGIVIAAIPLAVLPASPTTAQAKIWIEKISIEKHPHRGSISPRPRFPRGLFHVPRKA